MRPTIAPANAYGFTRAVVCLLAVCLLQGVVDAQSLNLRNYDPRQGLSSSETYYALQDRRGYIWIASDAGVSRFDGKRFRIFTKEDGLADNTVFNILEDHAGRIWFFGYSGAVSYFSNDSMHGIGANDTLRQLVGYRNEVVVSYEVDIGDTIWLSYNSRDAYIKVPPGNHWGAAEEFREWRFERNFIYREGSATPMYTTKEINSSDSPFGIIWPDGRRSFSIKDMKRNFGTYIRLCATGRDEFLFSLDNCLFHVKKGSVVAEASFGSRIIGINRDRRGDLWIGVHQHGVYCFRSGDLNANPRQYLEGMSVTSVLLDHENGLWLTTLEKGAFYTPSAEVMHFVLPGGSQHITVLFADSTQVYAGTAGGKVIRITGSADGRFVVREPYQVSTEFAVGTINPHPEGIVIGSDRYTLTDPDGKHQCEFTINGSRFDARDLAYTKDGRFILASWFSVRQVTKNGDRIRRDSLPVRINNLHLHSDGSVFVGCMNGLWKLTSGGPVYLGNTFAALRNPVSGMHSDRNGGLWVATRGGGVVRLFNNKLTAYDSRARHCTSVCEDANGVIWVGSNSGIYRIHPADGSIRRYATEHGLLSNEIKSIVYFRDHLFLATPLGLDVLPVSRDLVNHAPPPVHLSAVLFKGRPIYTSDNPVTVSHLDRDPEFRFSGFSFKKEEGAAFQYRLAGYDPDWTSTTSENARYTNLPPATYTFEVKAVNNDGVSSASAAAVIFTIAIPPWKKWWVIVLLSVVAAGIAGLLLLVIVKKVKAGQRKRDEIGQLIIESRLTALRAQMNPHFIFNVINSIQHFILHNKKEEAYDYLSRFSRLIRMVLDNSRFTSLSLESEVTLLTLYMDLEKLRFENEFDYTIEVNTATPPRELSLPNMLIQPFIENAIVHGIAPGDAKGDLRVSFTQKDHLLHVMISDNGIGRERSRLLRQNSQHRSAGMLITEERIRTLSDFLKQRITVEVLDLVNAGGDPAGTTVNITIPINQT